MRPVRLTSEARAGMAARAEADYPEETCGFVFRSGTTLEVVPMENVQNRLHAEDPGANPRDARTAYCFDTAQMLRVLAEKEKAGAVLHAIYHSHPDHASYFSETDSEAAAPLGEPSYPGAAHLVFSVKAGKAVDLKAFDWSAKEGRFIEVPIEEDR
jgi:proteasome lid subunit RPN8/RPN11